MKYIFLFLYLLLFTQNTFCDQASEAEETSSILMRNSKNIPFSGTVRRGQNIEFYKEGKPHGKWLQFYPNGSLKCIENWNEGKLSGKYILYKNDETKILENSYFKGKDHGRYIMYHENGVVYITGEFYYGKAIGMWYYYNDKGKLVGKNDFTANSPKPTNKKK